MNEIIENGRKVIVTSKDDPTPANSPFAVMGAHHLGAPEKRIAENKRLAQLSCERAAALEAASK